MKGEYHLFFTETPDRIEKKKKQLLESAENNKIGPIWLDLVANAWLLRAYCTRCTQPLWYILKCLENSENKISTLTQHQCMF